MSPRHVSQTYQSPTPEELLARFGPVIWEALIAFATDYRYPEEMARVARVHEERVARGRRTWASRQESR